MVFLGCTHSMSQESTPEVSQATGNTKASRYITWEQWFEKMLIDKSPKTKLQIFCLTSSGGFHGGGSGNFFVAIDEQSQKGNLFRTPPMHAPKNDAKVPYTTHLLNREVVVKFLKEKESFADKPFSTQGFDIYRYTFTKYKFSNNKLQRVSKPISFDDPFVGGGDSESHREIINAFNRLKPQDQKK